jgi:rhodanese-related sulfurtransferase
MSFLNFLFGGGDTADLKQLIDEGAFLVDVRTPGEFAGGHVKGSVNIPLDNLQTQISQFKDKKHIIVFCRSGNRSGMAKNILEQNGFKNVVNGGTWERVSLFV